MVFLNSSNVEIWGLKKIWVSKILIGLPKIIFEKNDKNWNYEKPNFHFSGLNEYHFYDLKVCIIDDFMTNYFA